MYIEQIETSEKSLPNDREGIGSSLVRLVDYAFRAKFLHTEESVKTSSANVSLSESEEAVVIGKKMKTEEESRLTKGVVDRDEIPRDNLHKINEIIQSADEKVIVDTVKTDGNVCNVNEKNSNENTEMEIEESEKMDEDDSFEFDNEEESSGLFNNKIKSIFIRKSSGLESTDDLSTRVAKTDLPNGEKELVKKPGKSPRKFEKKRAISFVDTLLSLFVVGPLVIGQWRGIWTMMDIYNEYFSEWLCFIVGTGLHVLFAIGRDGLHGRFVEKLRINHGTAGRVAYDLVRLMYIYIFCIACNAHWRGGWKIFSRYCGTNIWVSNSFTIIFAAGLVILRSFRNLLAPPFIVVIDRPERVFHFPTRYNVNTRDWSLYILDCAFSVGVVGSLVVFVWRGAWVLFELHLFPENREYSAIGSLVIGYIIVAVTFCLQPLMRYTCARLKGLARLLAADAFLLLSFLGTVNVWRGIWTVLDLWLLPDNLELSCWITHVGCFVFLVLLNCSNSILVRGVYIDAEEEEGRCVVFPCHYLRLFFKIERQKKEARRQNLVASSKEPQPRNEANEKEVESETLLNRTNAMPTIIPANPESFV
ncbi:uncharacterized protein fusl isoform X1 [Venturia canescens]|uniref:uncharacterized protein fusl isoform X1 n=1 Tax=Venturia canescens TaxID=32260 RepID=UPI001C9D3F7C|nr:uncharacterized protein LOC122412534 isoform X1 [Venturia canescens]